MRLRSLLKETVYGAAHALGAPALGRKMMRDGLVVLTYHSFGPGEEYPYLNRMPLERLRSQLRWLKRNFEIVSLRDGFDRIGQESAGQNERPMVAITADDGYSDNFEYFFPLIVEHSVPATVFLATDYLDSGRLPWPTRLAAMLHFAQVAEISVPLNLSLATPEERLLARAPLNQYFSRLEMGQRETQMQDLERKLAPKPHETLPPLTWEYVRGMQAHGIEFGSHTVFHGWLDQLDDAEVQEELVQSKARIEAETGAPCSILAYPNGNWNDRVAAQVAKAGYQYALSQDRGVNRASDLTAYAVKRVEIPFNERLGTFACRVSGVAA